MTLAISTLSVILAIVGAALGATNCLITQPIPYYSCPELTCRELGTYPKDADLTLECYSAGTDIKGNTFWDKTEDDVWISETYLSAECTAGVQDPCPYG